MAKQSLSDRAAGLGDNLVVKKRDPSTPAQTSPARLMEFSGAAQEWEDEVATLKEKLKNQKSGVQLFPLEKLHKVSGRQRSLSKQERAELLENLRINPLDTPITVVRRNDGEWEIVSGNNRVDIYLELGRTEIEGIEKQYTIQEANRQAYFSNFLHPSLPDFEKFTGFKFIMELENKSIEETASAVGISKSASYRIMAFDKLPVDALDLIKANPFAFGSSTAEAFVKILEDSTKKRLVIETIKEIIDGEITQDAGIKKAKTGATNSAPSERPAPITIRSGKSNYCKIVGTKQTIRLDFASEEERIDMESEIMEILNARAAKLKK
ncbi:ParB family chromosome partitioning protein [Oxalobacteraceae bacterium GrIS 2.11]